MPHHHISFPIRLAPSARLKVLVADDSTVVRLVTRSLLLSRWQIDLRMVRDGVEAVQSALDCEFDIVLMDLQMPIMDGFAATRAIRRSESAAPLRRRTPIVAYTSSLSVDVVDMIRECGMDSVLTKPAGPHAMCAALHNWGARPVTRVPTATCDREMEQPEYA